MIQLTEELFMIANDRCYTVGKVNKQRSNGEQGGRKAPKLLSPTYYTTVDQAVRGALNRAMRQAMEDGSVTTLREFIREQDRQRAGLEKLIASLESGKAQQDVVETREAAKPGDYTSEDTEGRKSGDSPAVFAEGGLTP